MRGCWTQIILLGRWSALPVKRSRVKEHAPRRELTRCCTFSSGLFGFFLVSTHRALVCSRSNRPTQRRVCGAGVGVAGLPGPCRAPSRVSLSRRSFVFGPPSCCSVRGPTPRRREKNETCGAHGSRRLLQACLLVGRREIGSAHIGNASLKTHLQTLAIRLCKMHK